MTLAELRTAVRNNLFDSTTSGDFWTDPRLTVLLNQIAKHVANQVAGRHAAHFYVNWTTTLSNAADDGWVTVTPAAPYTVVREVIAAERTVAGFTDDNRELKLIDFARVDKELERISAAQQRPPVFLFGSQVGFLRPADGIGVRVVYVATLPDMVDATDTPGQVSGSGTANLLPPQYQHLIVTEATIAALAALGLDPRGWETILARQQAAAGLELAGRRREPGEG